MQNSKYERYNRKKDFTALTLRLRAIISRNIAINRWSTVWPLHEKWTNEEIDCITQAASFTVKMSKLKWLLRKKGMFVHKTSETDVDTFVDSARNLSATWKKSPASWQFYQLFFPATMLIFFFFFFFFTIIIFLPL